MSGYSLGDNSDQRQLGTESNNVHSLYHRAVVVEVYHDISLIDIELIKDSSVINKQYVDRLPRNSILARTDKAQQFLKFCYPFYPPHIQLPIKPGEQVWIFNDPEYDMSYWVCRIPGSDFVDDVNYTHLDRELFKQYRGIDNSERSIALEELESSEDPVPSFPNGNGDNALTLKDESGISDNVSDEERRRLIYNGFGNYEDIIKNAIAYKAFHPESVPRYTKRPGDMVIQGSNNTLISLGRSRGWSQTNRPDGTKTNANDNLDTSRGAIDMVAGRGYYSDTAADRIENTRGDIETDKDPENNNPDLENHAVNPQEGDPDFINDASRIYQDVNINLDDIYELLINREGSITDKQEESAPSALINTDHIRLLARRDLKIVVGNVETGSAVVLRANGDVVFLPGPDGVIRLGGEDADKALVTSSQAPESIDGNIKGVPIFTSAGGVLGAENAGSGQTPGGFATKVLVK